ncbi:MAG: hypothetical protein CME17_02235 [Gemmatimonadetes bacterium]|nr:hypothetical protein [Gemmatimonadota bacterium]
MTRQASLVLLGSVLAFMGLSGASLEQVSAQEQTHALIVVGLGGNADYRDRFHNQAVALREALTSKHGMLTEHVTYLGERPESDPEVVTDKSTRDNVLSYLSKIAQQMGSSDRLLVILIGHGTSDQAEARFNVTGPDLAPSDLQMALTGFPTQTLALVHTGSASGGFLGPLSGPNRIIITATRTQRERNATEFAQFFVEAITGENADLDKDERVSLLEAYQYAREEVVRFYENENEILTEHAVLDDNGDGTGSEEVGLNEPDGSLAAGFQLGGISVTEEEINQNPELLRLYEERSQIQARITELRVLRDAMQEEAYMAAMEELLVELALKNREIRAKEGDGL